MTLHVIGAGLAGLSTALRAADAGFDVVVHESSGHAGGRCRSWFDSEMDAVIDNGTHMLVGANRAAFRFLARVGATAEMRPCPHPLPMRDVAGDRSWTARPARLVGAVLASLPRMAFPGEDAVAQRLGSSGQYRDFWEPLAVSVMNTPADQASARVFRTVLARTLWRGGNACRPYLARNGLSRAFAEPALAALRAVGATVRLNHPLRGLDLDGGRVRALRFDDETLQPARQDRIVLAVPWAVAARLVEGVAALPASPIVNAHFRLSEPPAKQLPDGVQGVVGGDAHWLFVRGHLLSVTVSAAAELAERSFGEVSERLWRDCAKALDLNGQPLAVRIVKEKRATLFHTPAVERMRPAVRAGSNLFLAGDWTATGLPCTIEGAITSGERAAAAVLAADRGD